MKYALSWRSTDSVPTIRHPLWWQFWKRAELFYETRAVRHAILDIPQDEADLLISATNGFWNNQHGRLLRRFMGGQPRQVQLERLGEHSGYIATTTIDGEKYTGARRVRNLTGESRMMGKRSKPK